MIAILFAFGCFILGLGVGMFIADSHDDRKTTDE